MKVAMLIYTPPTVEFSTQFTASGMSLGNYNYLRPEAIYAALVVPEPYQTGVGTSYLHPRNPLWGRSVIVGNYIASGGDL